MRGICTGGRSAGRRRGASFPLAAAAALLAACASPSPQMMRGERLQTEVAGSRFTLWRKGDAVEIYRTSPEMLPRLSEVMANAEIAVTRTTGCAVKSGSLAGDAALMTAQLDCG